MNARADNYAAANANCFSPACSAASAHFTRFTDLYADAIVDYRNFPAWVVPSHPQMFFSNH